MAQQTIWRTLTGGKILLAGLLIGLWVITMGRALPADATQSAHTALQQQIRTQGLLLFGSLRQARDRGLHGDPWAMAYALQEAHRLLSQIALAERTLYAGLSPKDERTALRQPPGPPVAPLDERLYIDVPLSGGRRQRLADLEQYAGFMPLRVLRTEITQASHDLNTQPPALGAALLATNRALARVYWQPGLQPAGWSRARDLVLSGYALALDSRHGVFERLARAQRRLRALPGGKVYARRLATLMRAPTLDLGGLRSLVQDLDGKVQRLRNRAERVRLERAAVELGP